MPLTRIRFFDPVFATDLRLALRSLRHGREIAGLAIGAIALVICGVTLIASVIVGTLIDQGPYRAPARVVGLQLISAAPPSPRIYFPFEDYLALQAAAAGPDRPFDALLPLGIAYVMMTGSAEPAHLNAGVMPAETFERLGMAPLLGRTLTRDDDRPGAPPVIVIGEEIWRQAFGGDPGAIGRTVRIDGRIHEIVGVMPRRFTWGVLTAWLPMRRDLYGPITGDFVQITGWLRAGVSEPQALERLQTLFSGLAATRGGRYLSAGATAQADPAAPLLSLAHSALPAVRDEVRQGLVVLLVSVTALAVVGCVNVAALLLARATGRLKELSVRVALGASRGQILRAQLLEAGMVAAAGAIVGIAAARVLLPALVAALPPGVLPPGAVVIVDSRVLWSMAATTLLIGLACGALPALLVTRATAESSLRRTPTGSHVSPVSRRVWRGLVAVEVAMAMALLVSMAVFGKSLLALRATPLHYSPDRVAALGITVSEQRYPTLAQGARFLQQALDRARTVSGVAHAAIAFPASPRNSVPAPFELTGRRGAVDERVGLRLVSADFYAVYEIQTLRGRALTGDDDRLGHRVAVVNDAFVRQFGADADVLGRHVRLPSLQALDGNLLPTYEIVGVTRDVVNNPATGRVDPEVAVLATTAAASRNWFILVRSADGDVSRVVKPIQQAVWQLDPDQAFRSIRTEEEMLWAARYGWPQFRALLLGLFGTLALALVACGAYGIVSYTTARDGRDIGVRLAIGAERRDILRDVLVRNLRPVLAGLAAGAAMAAAAGTFVRALIGSISPWDPAAYLAAAVTLLAVTAAACAIPARRASQLDPNLVLKNQ